MTANATSVLVTGAAAGLGRATALEFARRGADVALLDLDEEGLASVADEVQELGQRSLSWTGDVADESFAREAVRQTHQQWKRLDVLVNNAAWRELVPLDQITRESWQRTLDTCLTAPAFLSRWAAEVMEPHKAGVIVNVSSIMASRAGGVCPAYVAAKGGLDALTYELATLYGGRGIRVFGIAPGALETQLSQDYQDERGESMTDELRRWSEDVIPQQRWANPEEVARTIATLCGDDASYVHGTIVTVDGGWSHTHFPLSLRRRILGEL